jgi:hypothetical protein
VVRARSPERRHAVAPASELVRHEWQSRIQAEYRSAAITQEITLWLIQIGASPDLIRDGLRIVDDELVHAAMSRDVWQAAGGSGAVPLDRGSLGVARSHPVLEHDVIAGIVRIFCLGETVAVPLFQNLRRGATVPVARKALDRILKDEVRHREFGWTALTWLLERPDRDALAAIVRAGLPRWIADLERNYGDGLDGGIAAVTDDERAWGVAPWREYVDILHRAYVRDYAPRFLLRGIEFSSASKASP